MCPGVWLVGTLVDEASLSRVWPLLLADGVAAWGRLDVSLASFVLDRAWARPCGLAERCWDLMGWLQPRGVNAGSGKLV